MKILNAAIIIFLINVSNINYSFADSPSQYFCVTDVEGGFINEKPTGTYTPKFSYVVEHEKDKTWRMKSLDIKNETLLCQEDVDQIYCVEHIFYNLKAFILKNEYLESHGIHFTYFKHDDLANQSSIVEQGTCSLNN
jgi:hypothetical protein